MVAYVAGVPRNYIPLLSLPAEVEVWWLTRPASGMNFVHSFATDASGLMTRLNSCLKKWLPMQWGGFRGPRRPRAWRAT
jgi:hypothetical protein